MSNLLLKLGLVQYAVLTGCSGSSSRGSSGSSSRSSNGSSGSSGSSGSTSVGNSAIAPRSLVESRFPRPVAEEIYFMRILLF